MLGDKVSIGEEIFDLISRARQGPSGEVHQRNTCFYMLGGSLLS